MAGQLTIPGLRAAALFLYSISEAKTMHRNSDIEMDNPYGIDKRDFVEPIPNCPECGSDNVDKCPAEKERGFTRIKAHYECADCGCCFRGEDVG